MATSSSNSESCGNCQNLISSKLQPPFRFRAGQRDCPSCQLLADGLTLARGGSLDSYTSWEVHVQNGLVLSTEDNGAKVIVEFYCTNETPITPDSILFKEHIVPWWQDPNALGLCRAMINQDPPLGPDFQRPTRLLDLGSEMSGLESDLRLVDDTTGIEKYATLSHCWLQGSTSGPIQTKRDNIAAHRTSIRFRSLGHTFQQAVVACRRLGIRHLWIDSLCIIQDDVDMADWVREGANMDNIYAGSSATLSMHDVAAADVPRPHHPYHSVTYRRGSQEATIHVRRLTRPADLLDNVAAAPKATRKNEIAPNAAWDRVSLRGWCYQERALSRRVLHLTAAELLIEQDGRIVYCQCTHHHTNETVGFAGWLTSRPLPAAGRGDGDDAIIMSLDLAKYTWSNAVRQYTQRMFTRQTDLLPGLAGLARRMSRAEHSMENYVAGLWADSSPQNLTLLRWLCWQSLPWESAHPPDRYCDGCRPRPRRVLTGPSPAEKCKWRPDRTAPAAFVPSFSWVSRFGPCEFMHKPWMPHVYTPVAEAVRAVCDVKAEAPYGQVYGGFVDLIATLYPVLHFSTKGWTFSELVDSDLCQTEYAYVVDTGFPERWKINRLASQVFNNMAACWMYVVNTCFPRRWKINRPAKQVLKNVAACGKRYVVDAADDLPNDWEQVYLLELFRSTQDDTSIMLILVPDNSKDEVLKAHGLVGGDGDQKIQCYRRVGIGCFSVFEFVDLTRLPAAPVRLI